MRILAIDTATEACSVALYNDGQISAVWEICPGEHTQRILPMVDDILSQNKLRLAELSALAYGRGPGSFTGVRIAMGIAQGLALGAGLPLIGVSTLAAMAQSVWRLSQATRVLTAIDARMGEVYWAEYQRDAQGIWAGEQSEAVLTPQAVALRLEKLTGHWMTAGTGWQAWPEMANSNRVQLQNSQVTLPTAEDMLPLALQAFKNNLAQAVEQAEPVYLRNTVAWKKLPGRE